MDFQIEQPARSNEAIPKKPDNLCLSLHSAYIGGGRGVKDGDLGSLALEWHRAGQP